MLDDPECNLGRSHIVFCLIGQMWTIPGSVGEGCEPNFRSVLLEEPAIRGAGMGSVIYWMVGVEGAERE